MELRLCLDCHRCAPLGVTRCRSCNGQIGLSDASALLGTRLGRYQLNSVIGEGGMGIVFEAEHSALRRRVAIKLLLPELGQVEFLERFEREARLLAGLRHPHIVEIYDFDVSDFGVPYYVMERLTGMSLALALMRHGRALAVAELLPVLGGVVAALAHAHQNGVVHRDLKPENIFVAVASGQLCVKLLDFGIAKQVDSSAADTSLTQTGAVMGTPLYLTPEQMQGAAVSAATDQYALALIVAEMLIGRPLRSGKSITQILHEAMAEAIPATTLPTDLPAATRNALVRATLPDPTQRYPDIQAFLLALELPDDPAADHWLHAAGIDDLVNATASLTPLPDTHVLSGKSAAASTPVTVPLHAIHAATVAMAIRRGPAWIQLARWLALVLAVAIAVVLGLRAYRSGTGLENTATPPGAPQLQEVQRLAVPADAGGMLGVSDAGAVLLTSGGVYFKPLQAAREAARSVSAGQQVLGVTETGQLLLRRDRQILLTDAQAGTGEELIAVLPLPLPVTLAWRRDGRALAYVVGDAVMLVEAAATVRQIARFGQQHIDRLLLGDHHLLVHLQSPEELQLFDLDHGTLAWSAPSHVGDLRDLAWLEDAKRLAVCGFSPDVEVFDLATPAAARLVKVNTACFALHWLSDGPSLVIRAENELRVWNAKAEQRYDWPLDRDERGRNLPSFHWSDGKLWLSEPAVASLIEFAVGSEPGSVYNKQSLGEIWDLEQVAGVVYAAAADGRLWRADAAGVRDYKVHDSGITDIVVADSALATASDDRTLGVWRRADMSLTWRARGHDYLINQLWLAADGSALWSSSSDGSLKRWRWPNLEVQETVDLRRLLGKAELSLHALWFSEDQQSALVGTWNHALIVLHKQAGLWQARSLPVQSSAGYRMAHLPALNAVVVLGIKPTRLYLWDLLHQQLWPMPDQGAELWALTAGSANNRVLAAGAGVMIEYSIARDKVPGFRFAATARNASTLGVIGAATVDPAQRVWWLGSETGWLRRVGWDELARPVGGH